MDRRDHVPGDGRGARQSAHSAAGLVLLLVGFLGGACGIDALADSTTDAGEAVLAAVAADDSEALRALAARQKPDPWIVADMLCARGEFEAAAAFAEAGTHAYQARLPAYVRHRRELADDTATRKLLSAAYRALDAREPSAALEILDAVDIHEGYVTSIRVAFARAEALRALRRSKEGEAAYLAAAEAARELGWTVRVTQALFQASHLAYRRGEPARAAELMERQIALAREAEDLNRVAYCTATLGSVLTDMGAYTRAQTILEAALDLARKLQDPQAIVQSLNNLGVLGRRRGELDEALAAYEHCRTVARDAGLDKDAAIALGNIGVVRLQQGDHGAALESHRKALAIFETLGEQDHVARAIGSIGVVHRVVGDYDEALEAQQRALAICRKTGNRRELMRVLGNLGVIHKNMGNLRRALDAQGEALALSRQARHVPGVIRSLINLGILYKNLAEFDRALACYREGLELAEKISQPELVGSLHANAGLAQLSRGSYPEALQALECSLEIGRRLGTPKEIANTLANLAAVYMVLGEDERAQRHLEESLAISERVGDRSGEASALANLAGLRHGQGDLGEARELRERVLQRRRELEEQAEVAEALLELGGALAHLDLREQALALQQEGLELAVEIGAQRLVYRAHDQVGRRQVSLGRLGEGRKHFQRCLEMAEEHGAERHVAQGLEGLARVAMLEGRHDDVTLLATRSIAHLDRWASGLAEEHGAHVRGEYASVFGLGARAARTLGDDGAVHRFLEAGRAGVLLQSLGGRDRLKAAVLSPDLLHDESEALSEESVALWRYRRALDSKRRAPIRAARSALAEARDRVRRVVERIQVEARRQADLLYPKPDDLQATQRALREGEVYVAYGLYGKDALAFVVTGTSARSVVLPGRERIEAAMFDCAEGAVGLSAAIARLRRLVVDPLRLPSDTRRVLIAPDGVLSYVPFALLVPKTEIVYVPSATTYALLAEERVRTGKGVLALADPTYEDLGAAGPVLALRSGRDLTPLAAARDEAKGIGDVLLLGKDAAEERLREALGQRSRWSAVHFACHGFVDPESPARAWLALADEEGRAGDLTCLEVYRMTIPSDLVVLSACQTGKGKIYATEGVVGFTRAFLFAGASRVIVSLWRVDDEATKALMKKFYEFYKAGEVSTAEALLRAQEYVASHEQWKPPRFWAAWQLWGVPD